MKNKNDAPGMRGNRPRDEDGELRRKRGDTHMGTVENEYHRDFGVRSDMKLENFLKEKNIDSLSELIKSGMGEK